jgi:hypothetical protein
MRLFYSALICFLLGATAQAKTLIFWEQGFPTIESQPVLRGTLEQTLHDADPIFIGLEELREPQALSGADLLVLPYGSAFPASAWKTLITYLRGGGNLLVLGGRPFRVPVENRGEVSWQVCQRMPTQKKPGSCTATRRL